MQGKLAGATCRVKVASKVHLVVNRQMADVTTVGHARLSAV